MDSSSQSIFGIISSKEEEQSKCELIVKLTDVSLQENAVNLKTKVFKSGKQTVKGMPEGMSAKDMWTKYMPDESYISDITSASGVEYSAEMSSLLMFMMDSKPFPRLLWKTLFMRLIDNCLIGDQRKESVVLACGQCELSTEPTGNPMVVAHGTRTVNNLFTQAVLSGNMEALVVMVDYVVECESLGVPPAVNPNEPQKYYTLATASLTADQMVDIGGPGFTGMHKSYFSVPANEGKSVAASAASSKLGKKQGSFVAAADDVRVDLDLVPKFDSVTCVWTSKNDSSFTPLELAFRMQNEEAFNALLGCSSVLIFAGALRLQTDSTHVLFPRCLAMMKQLTSLTVYFKQYNYGPVPKEIFELVSLQELMLADCDFTEVPDDIAKLINLQTLDICNLPINNLPLISMSKMEKLTSVNCLGTDVKSIPREIIEQGPEATAQYIQSLGEGAETNNDVLLMLIGDGEAGKTSMLQALKNTETHCAREIGVDERTVGIDISSFQPNSDQLLRFFAWDFGGQGIYAIMQQLFVSRRALYPLLWRVRQSLDVSQLDHSMMCDVCKKVLVAQEGVQKQQPVYRVKGQGLCHAKCVSYEPLITSWTERLQFRVPGVSMVLVATHIDCATPAEVDEQCDAVTKVVERLLARQAQTMPDVPPLKIYRNGESLRVNNMNGEGVKELRDTLCEIAAGLDFYGEMVPASYVRLKQKLREMQRHGDPTWRTWLHWEEYQVLATDCGLNNERSLKLATKFLHDVGELRYFGDQGSADQAAGRSHIPAEVQYDSDGDPIEPEPVEPEMKVVESEATSLLAETVFPNPFWIVDVLRSLIRHDHSVVLDLVKQDAALSTKDRRTLRRRVYRLMQRGILHESLLHYVWHGVAGLSASTDSNADEFRRLLALMKAFNILMDKPGETLGTEWIVPTLSAGRHSHTIESSAFVDDSMPFVCRLVYDALPPYFDMILVAHIMNSGIADSVDFIKGAAAFHQLGHQALLFAGLGKVRDPRSVFRSDQLCEERLRTVLRDEQCHVVIAATSRTLMIQLINEVSKLESFFPGLRRLTALFPCYSCRTAQNKRKQALAGDPSALAAAQEGATLWEAAEAEDELRMQTLSGTAAAADDLNCAAYYFNNRAVLDRAFNDLVGSDLEHVLEIRADGTLAIKYEDNCKLNATYSSGYEVVPPRFHQEVMTLLMDVISATDPATLHNDAHQTVIEACQAAVAERQFATAFQQAGSELPSHRTVQKYCTKHIDALVAAWELCPELEVLCMGLNGAVQEGEAVNTIVTSADVAKLKREDAVPEYMHLLRSVVELVNAKQRPQSSQKDRTGHLESYRRLLEDRRDDLAELYRRYPELKPLGVGDSAPDHSANKPFLAETYGVGSTLFQEQHCIVLSAVLSAFDAQCAAHPPAENQLYVAQDLSAGSHVPTAQSFGLRASLMRTCFNSFCADFYDTVVTDLSNDPTKPSFYPEMCIKELLLPESVEEYIYAEYAAYTEELVSRIQLLDSSINVAASGGISSAYDQFLRCNSRYLPLLSGRLPYDEVQSWVWYFKHKKFGQNLPPKFCTCSSNLEKAQMLLMLLQYLQAIKKFLEDSTELSAEFDEVLPPRPSPDFSDRELTELWDFHQSLHGAVFNNTAVFKQANLQPEDVAAKNCCLYVSGEAFVFGSPELAFRDAFVACNTLKSVYAVLQTNSKGYGEYVALQSAMNSWAARYPASTTEGYEYVQPIEKQFTNIIENPASQLLALKLAFLNRPLSILLLECYQSLQAEQDTALYNEVIRTVKYLQDPQRDPQQLLPLIQKRMEDIAARRSLINQLLNNQDCKLSIDGIAEKWSQNADRMVQLTRKLPKFSILIKESGELSDFLRKIEDGIRKLVEHAKESIVGSFRAYAWKTQMWDKASAKIDGIIQQARADARDWSNRHVQSVAVLREGPLPAALSDLTAQTKLGIKVYGQLLEAVSNATQARIIEAVQSASVRADKYANLSLLRSLHAPPWHFGGGQRVRNKKLRDGAAVAVQQLKPEKWRDDWRDFADGENQHGVERMCPAETVLDVQSTVQAAENSSVLINCTKAGLPWMEQIVSRLSAIDLRLHCLFLKGEDSDPYFELGSWVYCSESEPVAGGDQVSEGGRRLGVVVQTAVSGRIRNVCLCFNEREQTFTRVEFDTWEFIPELEQWKRKDSALLGSNVPVEVNCDGRQRRGVIAKSRVTGKKSVLLSVRLDGAETSELYPIDTIRSIKGIEGSVERHWVRALRCMPGHRVMVSIDGTQIGGITCEEDIHVQFEDGTVGVFPMHLVEPVDVETEIALGNGKVLICCIDSTFSANDKCAQQLLKAEELGLGIIPVLLPGYTIENYQEWWPPQLPAFKRHSSFIDLRAAKLNGAGKSALIGDVCASAIAPTLRVLLSEWKDRGSAHAPAAASTARQDHSVVSTGENGVGDQFVHCEMCASESTNLGSTSEQEPRNGNHTSCTAAGTFDRWRCQQLVVQWTAEELQRREKHPDQPSVMVCPVSVRCSGGEGHEKLARDVLAIKEKRTSYPCPSCLTKGVLPPYCFDREVCLAELEYKSGGSILCKRCHQATPLHELLTCEVFLSYCWGSPQCPQCTVGVSVFEHRKLKRGGHCELCDGTYQGNSWKYDTQRLVTELKGAVEPEAGVMCWQDVDRLVGGKDLEREMEVGVKQADVIVIFLDDGYVRSHNCRREYLHATKHGKYIIPILLRGYSGGAGPEKWWPESMSSLAQFQPITLTDASQMENVLFEVCERIQSRFHRAQRFPTADDAIAYLRDYSSWGVTRKAFLVDSLSLDRREEAEAHLQRAFVKMDTDGNNLVDEAELTAFLDENNLCLSREQISTLIMEADIDHNGSLSLDELKLAIFAMLEEQARVKAV